MCPIMCPALGHPWPWLQLLQAEPYTHPMDQGVIKGRDTRRNFQASYQAEVWGSTAGWWSQDARSPQTGPQRPWESCHHGGIVDLGPSKTSTARNHKEQGNTHEKLGVLEHGQHRHFSCSSGTRWISSHSSVPALPGKAALSYQQGGSGYLGVKCPQWGRGEPASPQKDVLKLLGGEQWLLAPTSGLHVELTKMYPPLRPHVHPGSCHSTVAHSHKPSSKFEGNVRVACQGIAVHGNCQEVWKISHEMFSPHNTYVPRNPFFSIFLSKGCTTNCLIEQPALADVLFQHDLNQGKVFLFAKLVQPFHSRVTTATCIFHRQHRP